MFFYNSQFHNSVYETTSGEPYVRIASFDFNALYAWSMLQDLPTGVPIFYRKNKNKDVFSMEITCNEHGWSRESLDWLNYMSYDERFRKPDGSFYPMKTIISGEHTVTVEGYEYKIDGYVETAAKKYFLEYFGCR